MSNRLSSCVTRKAGSARPRPGQSSRSSNGTNPVDLHAGDAPVRRLAALVGAGVGFDHQATLDNGLGKEPHLKVMGQFDSVAVPNDDRYRGIHREVNLLRPQWWPEPPLDLRGDAGPFEEAVEPAPLGGPECSGMNLAAGQEVTVGRWLKV